MAFVSGTITISSAGTPQRAAHKGNVRVIMFKARPANAANIYVGGPDVAAADGMVLEPDDAVTLEFPEPISTSQFYADADTSADAVDFIGVA